MELLVENAENKQTDLTSPQTNGGFPGGSVVKSPPASAGDTGDSGSTPGLGRSPGGGHGNPLQYSCLMNPMDRRAWRATLHAVAKSRTRLKQLSTHTQHRPMRKQCLQKFLHEVRRKRVYTAYSCRWISAGDWFQKTPRIPKSASAQVINIKMCRTVALCICGFWIRGHRTRGYEGLLYYRGMPTGAFAV